jgi:hypothetical protein
MVTVSGRGLVCASWSGACRAVVGHLGVADSSAKPPFSEAEIKRLMVQVVPRFNARAHSRS